MDCRHTASSKKSRQPQVEEVEIDADEAIDPRGQNSVATVVKGSKDRWQPFQGLYDAIHGQLITVNPTLLSSLPHLVTAYAEKPRARMARSQCIHQRST